ncbi:MAG: fimbrillin family protein, partial [Rikenellaceae bacterium]
MKRLLLAALAISMAASCQKESTAASPEGAGLVQLTSQGIATKVAGDEWQAGDGIGVFTDGMLYNDHSNIAYTAASDGAETAFSATDPIYWRAGQSADVTFTAYY